MSRHTPPLPFSPHYDFHAQKRFTWNGKTLNVGDPVDTKDVPEVKLRRMYEARMISPLPPAVLPIAPPASQGEAPTNSDASATDAPAKPAGGLVAKHRGFGKWYLVNEADENVEGPFTKEEAESRAAGQKAA